jgi:hypothetical protein
MNAKLNKKRGAKAQLKNELRAKTDELELRDAEL